ncbi:undecaprenyl diphosphate synthase family protein, partial [Methanothrix sp.]|uniref:undecaprenyl diphosphate synthase family protein n=1 Tax=Methanothrix sp. TaxID=90426 RepID=UPI003BB6707D
MSQIFRNPVYLLYEKLLKAQILAGSAVEHIAIIQDGNRRYARQNGLAKSLGHSLGAETSEKVLDWCLEMGVRHISRYAFSTE